ncbi:hypothetical protein B0H16DRAFT_1482088 [Mycena metata]|uniref:Uncharacterized protein n=1 Tax=Mycena metata TaxID=1033252 RepID=A0AAD7M8T9_9AGAR|nr:hypothetical protein B0H16DRAFT_1482088 [Mycena metata]
MDFYDELPHAQARYEDNRDHPRTASQDPDPRHLFTPSPPPTQQFRFDFVAVPSAPYLLRGRDDTELVSEAERVPPPLSAHHIAFLMLREEILEDDEDESSDAGEYLPKASTQITRVSNRGKLSKGAKPDKRKPHQKAAAEKKKTVRSGASHKLKQQMKRVDDAKEWDASIVALWGERISELVAYKQKLSNLLSTLEPRAHSSKQLFLREVFHAACDLHQLERLPAAHPLTDGDITSAIQTGALKISPDPDTPVNGCLSYIRIGTWKRLRSCGHNKGNTIRGPKAERRREQEREHPGSESEDEATRAWRTSYRCTAHAVVNLLKREWVGRSRCGFVVVITVGP